MKLRCIKGNDVLAFTLNKEYEVIKILEDDFGLNIYFIINDNNSCSGVWIGAWTFGFEIVP